MFKVRQALKNESNFAIQTEVISCLESVIRVSFEFRINIGDMKCYLIQMKFSG